MFSSSIRLNRSFENSLELERLGVSSLCKKEILKKDTLHNYELTNIGKLIVTKISRDTIIDEILGD
jgi:hypothetical protein